MFTDLHLLEASDFSGLINQVLYIRFNEQVRLPAELIEVNAWGESTLDRRSFSITLRTEQKDNYYPQAIYIIEHPEKGDMEVFLAPLGFDEKGLKYEAVFS